MLSTTHHFDLEICLPTTARLGGTADDTAGRWHSLIVAFGAESRSCTIDDMRTVAHRWAGAELDWESGMDDVPLDGYDLMLGDDGALHVVL